MQEKARDCKEGLTDWSAGAAGLTKHASLEGHQAMVRCRLEAARVPGEPVRMAAVSPIAVLVIGAGR